ncbi:MAG: TldD/PmbA family protein [Microthrixaceae bacterium]|nr:TldD/PmbA family protein [Microthrixaceae bacterium]
MIDSETLQRVLGAALSTGAEWAEVFAEDRRSTGAVLDDGKVEELTSGRDRGAGIRVVVGDSTGFAHTSDLSEAALLETARIAAQAARGAGEAGRTVQLRAGESTLRPVGIYPDDIGKARKVELLTLADQAARTAGSGITQVTARYSDSRRRIQVANSEGIVVGDDQVRTLLSVSCVATGDTGMQTGRESVGHTIGFELFDRYDVEDLAATAAQRALTKLAARPAPSGQMTVVIGSGGGGVMFHEACGHGLEADLVEKGASVFAGRLGELVASPLVTLVDDGTLGGEWGNFGIDDEGHVAQRNVLIEDGVLVDYMWDGLRARKEGRTSSGNGRRQSYQHLPMVRMTNTYLLGGSDSPEDIIADTDSGVYIAHLGGGQVNTATGDFVFGMTEAYLIEGGRITEPLREGNLIGNGPAVLGNIDAVGNDFAMGPPGTCGKDGQGVPVGDGVPTLRVHGLTIGGTAA